MNFQSATMDDVITLCEQHNGLEWLATYLETKDENGNTPSFIKVKRAAFLKFAPELVPVATTDKKPSMLDKVKARLAAK